MSRIGRLPIDIPAKVKVEVKDRKVFVEGPKGKLDFELPRRTSAVVEGAQIKVMGFKAAVQSNKVNLSLGYSHPINYPIPDQIKVTVEENTKLTIEGPSKEVVGQVAAEMRSFYPPEPYKGKGVRYLGEQVVRKEGKTVQ